MAGVFHVQYGMNETPLTCALERGDFKEAEKMIKDCTSASYLDEGCYTRTPLFIALHPASGVCTGHEVNLYIAKLLVEHGADPNIRIPNTDGAEFLNAGETPLELVVDIHRRFLTCPTVSRPGWSDGKINIIGLNKKHIHSKEEFQEDIYQMCSVLIGYGATTNIVGVYRYISPIAELFLTCQTSLKLIELFLQNGADVNLSCREGCTPLMVLCSGMYGSMMTLPDTPNDECCNESHRQTCVKYLEMTLEYGHVQVNKINKRRQSALFLACAHGNFGLARLLLQHGALVNNGEVVAKVLDVPLSSHNLEYISVSPLFASFACREVKGDVESFPFHGSLNLPGVEMLVDSGKFISSSVWDDFCKAVEEQFPVCQHLLKYGDKLIYLMFGNLTSDLVQKSTRAVFWELCRAYFPCDWEDCLLCMVPHLNFWMLRKCFDLHDILSKLQLPVDLYERFEMEWLRLGLCLICSERIMIGSFMTHDLYSNDEDDDFEDESDMEFW